MFNQAAMRMRCGPSRVGAKVGRNGAGKTTLMSTIAAGGVSGMSSDVKTLHVKPEAASTGGREFRQEGMDSSLLKPDVAEFFSRSFCFCWASQHIPFNQQKHPLLAWGERVRKGAQVSFPGIAPLPSFWFIEMSPWTSCFFGLDQCGEANRLVAFFGPIRIGSFHQATMEQSPAAVTRQVAGLVWGF